MSTERAQVPQNTTCSVTLVELWILLCVLSAKGAVPKTLGCDLPLFCISETNDRISITTGGENLQYA